MRISDKYLLIGGTVLGAELTAFALLKAGYSTAISLGCTAVAGFCFLAWPILAQLATAAAQGSLRAVTPLARRGTYRYRLSTLLILMFIVSSIMAWYSYQLRQFEREYWALSGKWRILNEKGQPLFFNGRPLLMEFDRAECRLIDVSGDVRSIDFRTPSGICEAIYKWERGRLRLRQSSEGLCRPGSFETDEVPQSKPGAGPGPFSCSHWVLERITVD